LAELHRGLVGAEHDVGVEDGEQGGEVPGTGGSEERIDKLRLPEPVGVLAAVSLLHRLRCSSKRFASHSLSCIGQIPRSRSCIELDRRGDADVTEASAYTS